MFDCVLFVNSICIFHILLVGLSLPEVGTWSTWTEWSDCPQCYSGDKPVMVQYAECKCDWVNDDLSTMNCTCSERQYLPKRIRTDLCPTETCPSKI